jgi:ribosomal protein S18 acetylase RimI-like enzyme
MTVSNAELLNNPVWHALTGLQARYGVRSGGAARFHADVAPFFAIDDARDTAYRDLRSIIGDAPEARLFRATREPAPPGWVKTFEKPIVQMICTRRPQLRPDAAIETLARADGDDMMALAEGAKPGPFGPRTAELGAYVGIRVEGRLVAMAGERFKLPGFTEISAICTLPAFRGRGYGGAMVGHLTEAIIARGETPILHVFADNPAMKLYEAMGFAECRRLCVVWLAPDPTSART